MTLKGYKHVFHNMFICLHLLHLRRELGARLVLIWVRLIRVLAYGKTTM